MLSSILAEIGITFPMLLLMAVAAFATAVFHSFSGFAGALLLLICIAPILGIKVAVPVVSVAIVVSNVTRLYVFWREIHWGIYVPLMISSFPGMIAGAFIFVYLPADTIALLLGLFMAVSVPGRRYLEKKDVKMGTWGFVAVGPAYGVVSGVTMGAGLMLAPFFLGAGLRGAQLAAMTAALGVVLNATKTVVFGASPLLNFPLIVIGLMLGLCTMPGAVVGRWLLRRTSVRMHTLLIEGVILAGAVFFFSQAF
ncbi:MAG: sulfite exporter TauE/SafE family protein [Rhodospirillaceae bacterium]